MKNQCQDLTELGRNEFLELLQKPEELFNGTLGTRKTDPVHFELKEYAKPICSRPYLVPKLYEYMRVGRL